MATKGVKCGSFFELLHWIHKHLVYILDSDKDVLREGHFKQFDNSPINSFNIFENLKKKLSS